MTIRIGDKLPDASFHVMTPEGPTKRTSAEVFSGRKIVLFAVPGAFTPTCHRNHLPGYLEHRDAILAKGIDAIAVTSVNDVFVMTNWAKSTGAEGKIEFLADGNGDFTKAINLTLDATPFGLGLRSQRYSMVVDDGVVTMLHVEDVASKADASGAGALLEKL